MKTIILGAAGLLLSGTAIAAVLDKAEPAVAPAWVQDGKNMSLATSAPLAAKDAGAIDGSMIGNAMLIDWPAKSAATEPASDAKSFDVATKQVLEPATAEAPSTAAFTDKTLGVAEQGMGGPEEPEAVTTAAAAPATSYRPCAPGPGDDNCIQLYEPGVAESYAAWQANSGVPGTEQTAMGGPEESVEGAAAVPAAATSYPPCRSRADDRCIQLGENETLASAEGMGGPEELAAYEPLPEDAVMPASADPVYKDDSEDTQAI